MLGSSNLSDNQFAQLGSAVVNHLGISDADEGDNSLALSSSMDGSQSNFFPRMSSPFVPQSLMSGAPTGLQRPVEPSQFPFASNISPSPLYSSPLVPPLFTQPSSQSLLSGHMSPVPNTPSPLLSSLGTGIGVGRNPVANPVTTEVDNINKLGVLGEHTSATFISQLASLLDKPPALSTLAEIDSFIDNNGIEAIGVAMFRFCKRETRVTVGVMMLSHLADYRPALIRQHNGCSYALSVVGLHPNSPKIHSEARKLLKKCGIAVPQRFFDSNGCFRCRDLGLTNTLDACRDSVVGNSFEDPETALCRMVLSMLRFPHETSFVRQCMEHLFPDCLYAIQAVLHHASSLGAGIPTAGAMTCM